MNTHVYVLIYLAILLFYKFIYSFYKLMYTDFINKYMNLYKLNKTILFENLAETRFSQPESSLINCTWYKTNACCKRTEVASVFLSMFTLNQASQQCMNLMNYMMCYFCSPDQYIWYRG
jgi:hypothetical protein